MRSTRPPVLLLILSFSLSLSFSFFFADAEARDGKIVAPVSIPACAAIIDFVSAPESPDSGRIMADLTALLLRKQGGISILERQDVSAFLKWQNVTLPARHDPASVAAIGAILGSPAVLDGVVMEFGGGRESTDPQVVEVALRLLDTQSKKVTWEGSGRAVSGGAFRIRPEPMSQTAKRALLSALSGLSVSSTGSVAALCPGLAAVPLVPPAGVVPASIGAPGSAEIGAGGDGEGGAEWKARAEEASARLASLEGTVSDLRRDLELARATPTPVPGRMLFDVRDIQLLHFNTGVFATVPGMDDFLQTIADTLAANPTVHLELRGHTDADPGSEPDTNFQLSWKRALSISDALRAKKVDPERIAVKAFGDTLPVAPNSSKLNKTLNRRVEFEFVEGRKVKPEAKP